MNKNQLIWGAILVLLGCVFLLDNFYIMDVGDFFTTFWPVILILIGIKIILDRRDATAKIEEKDRPWSGAIDENNVFGDIRLEIEGKEFSGGSVNNVFGDITIDLSKADQQLPEARLHINGIFGDITIKTSRDVALQARANAVAGDIVIRDTRDDGLFASANFEDTNYPNATKKLVISTSIIFGSVNIL